MSGEALKDQFVRAVLSTLSLCRWTFLLEWVDNDRFLKKLYVIAAFIIVFIGSMWTISTYMNGIKGDAEREIFKQRLKTYELASKTVGELASLPDGAEWLKARDRFLSLYYGDLAMFESQTVTECMSQLMIFWLISKTISKKQVSIGQKNSRGYKVRRLLWLVFLVNLWNMKSIFPSLTLLASSVDGVTT